MASKRLYVTSLIKMVVCKIEEYNMQGKIVFLLVL